MRTKALEELLSEQYSGVLPYIFLNLLKMVLQAHSGVYLWFIVISGGALNLIFAWKPFLNASITCHL